MTVAPVSELVALAAVYSERSTASTKWDEEAEGEAEKRLNEAAA